jgi:hypothetical protein
MAFAAGLTAGFDLASRAAPEADADPTGAATLPDVERVAEVEVAGRAPGTGAAADPPTETPTEPPPLAGAAGGSAKPAAAAASVVANVATRSRWLRI